MINSEYFGIKPINFDNISNHGGITDDTWLHSGGKGAQQVNTKFTIEDLFVYFESNVAIWEDTGSGIGLITPNDVEINGELTVIGNSFFESNVNLDGFGDADFLTTISDAVTAGTWSSVNLSEFNNDLTSEIQTLSHSTGFINLSNGGGSVDLSLIDLSEFNNDLTDNNDVDYISLVAFNNSTNELEFTGVGNAFNSNLDLSIVNLSNFNNDLVDNNDIDYISNVAYNGGTGSIDYSGVGNAFNSNIDLSLIPLSDFNNDLTDSNDIDYISNVVLNNSTGEIEFTGIGNAFNSNIDLSTFNLSHFNNDLTDLDSQTLSWTFGTNTLFISGGNSQVIDTFASIDLDSFGTTDFLYTNSDAITAGTWGSINLSQFNDNISLWESDGANALMQISDNLNLLLGNGAGKSITTGVRNIVFGDRAGESISTSNENILLGYLAGIDLSGSNNVGIGYNVLRNTTGSSNFALGANSGTSLTSGSNNVFIGSSAGSLMTTGVGHVAIGYQALYSLSSTNGSTAVGYQALRNSNSFLNTAIGNQAGYNNVTGNRNVFIGNQAGYNELGSNKLYIENSNTTTPLIYGDFSTDFIRINGYLEVRDKSGTAITLTGWEGDKIVDTGISVGSLGDPDQTISFVNPDLSISGGNTVDISGVNYWVDIGTRYNLEDVYIGKNPGNIYSLRADLLSRFEDIYITGDLRDSGDNVGSTGDYLRRASGGGVEWDSASTDESSSFTGSDTTLSGSSTANININGGSTTIALPSDGKYLIMVSGHFYSQSGGLMQCTFTLNVDGSPLDSVQLDSDPQEYSIAMHGIGTYSASDNITISVVHTANCKIVSPKVSYIKLN